MMMDRTFAVPAARVSIDVGLLDRACGMQSTAEYLEVLSDIAIDRARSARASVRDHGVAAVDLGDWREIETLLNLITAQAKIVQALGIEAEDALSAARRA